MGVKGVNRYGNEVRGGWQAFMIKPFTDGRSVASPWDIPPLCARLCTWVPRSDGRYHLKYANRMCAHVA